MGEAYHETAPFASHHLADQGYGCPRRDDARDRSAPEAEHLRGPQGAPGFLRPPPAAAAASVDDGPAMVVVWCPRCRCHVYPPCQVCRLRAYQRRLRAVPPARKAPRGVGDSELAAKLALEVSEIGLPLRIVNYLQQQQIFTVNDLLHCTPEELLRIPNFAHKTLAIVYRCLARLGFHRRAAETQPVRRAA